MSNAYEDSLQKIIPAVLLYASFDDDVLMLRKKDHWNGLGGKIELGESPIEAAVREFEEEAGLWTDAQDWKWLGQLYFPNFKASKKEDWWVTVFIAQLNLEQRKKIKVQTVTKEGALQWVPKTQILELPLYEGDAEFLPYVFKKTPFQGTLFYQDGKCIRKDVQPIG